MSRQVLILAQVDDATGEVLQDAAEQLHALGARNLQVLASVGKKGRPGHVLMIDADEALESDIALVLGADLGVWGYRVLESRHRHFEVQSSLHPLVLAVGDRRFEDEIHCKRILDAGRLIGIKAEHRELVRVRDQLRDAGVRVSLEQLRAAIETQARVLEPGSPITVAL